MKPCWQSLALIFLSLLGSSCGKPDKPEVQNIPVIAPSMEVVGPATGAALAEPMVIPELVLTLLDPGIVAPLGLDGSASAWKVRQGNALEMDRDALFQPVRPGPAILESIGSQGQVQLQPVRVVEPESVDFTNDIMPLLTRHDCNSGGCHGRLDGQNGFKLSLFGYAAEQDYQAITRDSAGRRIDRMRPVSSLILLKASGRVSHGGGQAMSASSADYDRLKRWLEAGASEGNPNGRRLKSLRVSPTTIQASESGKFTAHAIAEFSDGSQRDVSAWSDWKSLDDRVAQADQFGRLKVLEPGETDLVVRYGSYVTTARISYAGPAIGPGVFESLASGTFIDKAVASHLQSLNIEPSPLADDSAYLRRATLDLVGRLPEPVEIRRFLKSTDREKRRKVVEDLLMDSDFTKFWSLKFGDLLQISTARQGNSAPFYLLWLQEQLDRGTAWDKIVRDLLTTRGDPASKQQAPAAYSLENIDPVAASQSTAQRLLGIRLRCAQCHDHPFDVWTQTQSHQFAAFFAKVRPIAPSPGQMMARQRIGYFADGQVLHPLTQKSVSPLVLSGNQPLIKPDTDPLAALADWITSAENPFMTRAFVNWLWAQFFATGLVDPLDDLSAANPPSHPALLDALARRFIELKFQIRPMIVEILQSKVYQTASQPTLTNARFARLNAFQAPRMMSAQQLADSLAQATGMPNRYTNKPTGTRALEIQDPATPSALLDTLGRCGRVDSCGSGIGGSASSSLRQSLLWISSDTVDGKLGAPSGYLRQLLDLEPEPVEIVESLFLRSLCRFPTDSEKQHWSSAIQASPNRPEIVEDLFWALLNTREFLFNH